VGSDFAPLCEAVFEALPCEIVVHDIDTIVAANAAACRLLGAPSPRSLVGLPISVLTHPDAREAGAHRRKLLFSQAQTYSCLKVKLVGLDDRETVTTVLARRFDVGDESYALVVGMGTMAQCSEAPYGWEREMPSFSADTPLMEAIIDSLPQPLNVFDAEGDIVFANAASVRVFGADPRDELVGSPLSSILHPVVHDAAAQRRRMVLEQGQVFLGVATKALTLDGTSIHTTGSLGRARLPEGDHVGFWMANTVEPVQTGALTV